MALSHAKDKIAVAVRFWEPKEFNQYNISVFFYNLKSLKKLHDQTIRVTQATQTQAAIPPVLLKIAGKGFMKEEREELYPRYVQSLKFSDCDKSFGVVLRNGPNQTIVRSYDYMLIKGKYNGTRQYDHHIHDCEFLQTDKGQIVVSG